MSRVTTADFVQAHRDATATLHRWRRACLAGSPPAAAWVAQKLGEWARTFDLYARGLAERAQGLNQRCVTLASWHQCNDVRRAMHVAVTTLAQTGLNVSIVDELIFQVRKLSP